MAQADVRDRLQRFEDAWQSGTPRLEDFLPPPADPARRSVLIELIKIDLEYRWRRAPGTPVHVESYRTRFPDLGTSVPLDLIGAEYLVRHWVGERPGHAEFLKRFPAQAEALRQELARLDGELADEPPAADAPSVELPVLEIEKPLTSLPALVDSLRSLSLVPPQTLEVVKREMGHAGISVEQFAGRLVERRWLTRFQAERLLSGRGSGLCVGSYVLLEPVGRGMSGQVFRARHTRLERIVALKLFSRRLVRDLDPQLIERFYVEMRAVGRLSHPHVVHAYDAGPVGQTHFLAMEYVDGVDLNRHVQMQGALPLAQAADYVRQAALGLQHVFENGLVHRDIKPSNLMVGHPSESGTPCPWGQLKILDLGLARLHAGDRTRSSGALTGTGQVMGTADYMAPEQALDPRQVDIRTDLYSLGCSFYFLLAGQPPFAGGTLLQRMNRHLEEEAPPLAGLRNDVPPELAAIINRLMAKDPRDRFATPAELAARLAAIIPRLPSGVDVPLTPTLELDADRTLSSGFSSLVLAPPPSGTEERRRRGRVLLLAAVAAAAGIVVCLMAFSFLIAWALATRPGAVRSEPSPAPPPRATRFVLDFDGGPRFVSLPDDLLHASPQLTIEAWFHTRESGGIFGYQVTTYPEVPPHWVPVLYVGGDGSLYGAVWRGQVVPLHGSTPVNDGRWHHAALTSDGHSQSLFQDGERVDSAPGVVHHLTMHRNQIGMARTTAWPQGNEDWFAFTGMIRDVRIWHESRTPEQVRADMTQTPSGSEPSLAAWYPLDESQGERVNDRSQRQRHGRLGGGDRRFQPKRTAVEE